MNNKTIKNFHNRSILYIKRNSAAILTCAGALGVIGTSIMAAQATIKATYMLNELHETKLERDEETPSLFEKTITVVPVFIPTFVMGTSTIICIFGANILNKQKQASLSSAYALSENCFKEYRNKLIELHGKEMDAEIRDQIVRSRCDYHQIDVDVPDRKYIFYDEISGESIVRYEREVMDAEYHLNRNFVLRGYASLNEFYSFLGMPLTDYGEELGWSLVDGYSWIDFEHRLISRDDGGTEIYSIDMIFSPSAEYLDGWT